MPRYEVSLWRTQQIKVIEEAPDSEAATAQARQKLEADGWTWQYAIELGGETACYRATAAKLLAGEG